MMATCDIQEGEILFEIPRSMLLHPETCSISRLLEEGKKTYRSPPGGSLNKFLLVGNLI